VSRADRVSDRVVALELDLLLVSSLVNVRYLTGFTGSSGLALVGPERRVFLTDFRYVEQAEAEVRDFDRERFPQQPFTHLAALLGPGALRLGFEDSVLTVAEHRRLREALPEAVELVPAGTPVEAERAVKEPGELERIRAASALADDVYRLQAQRGLVGRTEREVALDLEGEMRRRGAEPSFPSIVASGAHGALPHAEPRDVAIAAGTLVTLDIGARLDGYCSDCTRTWATGPLGTEETELYELVLRAQEAALAAVRPGPSGRDVDAVAREIIAAAGHGEHFGHGTGHGVGLEVHEGPRLGFTEQSDALLVAGHVVTIEPGVYLPGRTGARIEDLVFVTDDGHEVVSGFPKTLTTVG